jgi:hypothetical protein
MAGQLSWIVEPDAAEHAEAASPADGGCHLLGWREPDNRMLDTELVAQWRSHRSRLSSG